MADEDHVEAEAPRKKKTRRTGTDNDEIDVEDIDAEKIAHRGGRHGKSNVYTLKSERARSVAWGGGWVVLRHDLITRGFV